MFSNTVSNNTESNNDPESTSKMRFFELFIKNKNLIKQGLYLLEICQNAAGSTDHATDRRGHDGSSWTPSSHTQQFLLLLSSFPSTASMTDRHRHNGPSRASVPKHFNSRNMGTRITSLNFMTNLQDGPSQTRRTVMDSVVPYLCNFFSCSLHYPRRQVRWIVTSTTARRGSPFQNT